ncbi:hypothetical protein [Nocardia xishanensis]|uniref:hypothetical protein n=1 Tax=Nocardia xishanensis TaxID=238964 RepID=UPI000AF66251|nr:hypothetical protein [Nocardia xishanensis]
MTPRNDRAGRIIGIERGTAVLCAVIATALACGVALLTTSLTWTLAAAAAVCAGMAISLPTISQKPAPPRAIRDM